MRQTGSVHIPTLMNVTVLLVFKQLQIFRLLLIFFSFTYELLSCNFDMFWYYLFHRCTAEVFILYFLSLAQILYE